MNTQRTTLTCGSCSAVSSGSTAAAASQSENLRMRRYKRSRFRSDLVPFPSKRSQASFCHCRKYKSITVNGVRFNCSTCKKHSIAIAYWDDTLFGCCPTCIFNTDQSSRCYTPLKYFVKISYTVSNSVHAVFCCCSLVQTTSISI